MLNNNVNNFVNESINSLVQKAIKVRQAVLSGLYLKYVNSKYYFCY